MLCYYAAKPVQTSPCPSTFESVNQLPRTPFRDITNVSRNGKNAQHQQKPKCKAKQNKWEDVPLNAWSRNLFDEEYNQNHTNSSSVVYDENCGMQTNYVQLFANI